MNQSQSEDDEKFDTNFKASEVKNQVKYGDQKALKHNALWQSLRLKSMNIATLKQN